MALTDLAKDVVRLMFLAAVLAHVIGQVAIIVIGFKTNPDIGCLLVMLGPIMSLIFFIKNPRATAIPFAMVVGGIATGWACLILLGRLEHWPAFLTSVCHCLA